MHQRIEDDISVTWVDLGSWRSRSYALDLESLDRPAGVECYIDTAGEVFELVGEDGYDGLSMFIVDQLEGTHLGIIVPTASVPMQPDPPTAE